MRKVLTIGLGLVVSLMAIQANAVTQEEIQASIFNGITWLVEQQNPDGSWGGGNENQLACTAFAVVKLEDRAFEQGISPFNEEYEYFQKFISGLNYIFDQAGTYGEGTGICFSPGHLVSYETGIAMMAIAAGRDPTQVVDVPNSIVDGWTYMEVLQANVDFFAWFQNPDGGWQYEPDEPGGFSDNSITGYVVLGLAYAEDPLYGFNCTIPDFVKIRLSSWIDQIQVDGDTPHNGGSGYGGEQTSNVLRAGNLIFEMAFTGDTPNSPRMQRALDFLGRAWNDPDWLWEDMHSYPGWYGNPDWHGDPPYQEDPPDWWQGEDDRWHGWQGPSYQAMYCLMKGLTYAGIDNIDVDGVEVDWYDAFAARIVETQVDDGYWHRDYWGEQILATEWALLMLEAIAPPEQFISVFIDIKPQSCPNPLNTKIKGVLPVAILGTADFDVTTIDPASILLQGVAPIRWSIEDVSTPVADEQNDCTTEGADGYDDLALKFDSQEVVDALGIVGDGDKVVLILTGELFDGTIIEGEDCIIIKSKVKKGASILDGMVEINDTEVEIYPIPFDNSIHIELMMDKSEKIIIDMIDMNGRVVEFLNTGVLAAEVDHHFEFNTRADLSPGPYMLRIRTENGELIGREIIIKR